MLKTLKIRSRSTHYTHYLVPLLNMQGEKTNTYKVVVQVPERITVDDSIYPTVICLPSGPEITRNKVDEQTGLICKDICKAFDSNGEFLYWTLTMDKPDDLLSNESAGTVSE